MGAFNEKGSNKNIMIMTQSILQISCDALPFKLFID